MGDRQADDPRNPPLNEIPPDCADAGLLVLCSDESDRMVCEREVSRFGRCCGVSDASGGRGGLESPKATATSRLVPVLGLRGIFRHISKAEVLVPPRNSCRRSVLSSEGPWYGRLGRQWLPCRFPDPRLSVEAVWCQDCEGRTLPRSATRRAATHGIRKVASGASEGIPASQHPSITGTQPR